MNDAFGDRMKMFEQVEASRRCMPLLPICVRLDGKGFSRWTKDLARPYDECLSEVMVKTTEYLVEESNALIGYTQSDEISLILYSDRYESQVFFDGKIQKLVSVLASMCTVKFNQLATEVFGPRNIALFDCRVWTVPNQMEAANTLLWREQDASKNSISMAARHYYSHAQLFSKNGSEMQEMLFQKGVNWNDYPDFFKRGTFVRREKVLRNLTSEELEAIPVGYRPEGSVERTEIVRMKMPKFSSVVNRVGVVFNGEIPYVE